MVCTPYHRVVILLFILLPPLPLALFFLLEMVLALSHLPMTALNASLSMSLYSTSLKTISLSADRALEKSKYAQDFGAIPLLIRGMTPDVRSAYSLHINFALSISPYPPPLPLVSLVSFLHVLEGQWRFCWYISEPLVILCAGWERKLQAGTSRIRCV